MENEILELFPGLREMPDEKPTQEEYEGYIRLFSENNPMHNEETRKLQAESQKIHDIPVPRSDSNYMKYYVEIKKEEVAKHKRDWAEKNKVKKRRQWREWKERQKGIDI